MPDLPVLRLEIDLFNNAVARKVKNVKLMEVSMELVDWRTELERSKYDNTVGIRIAKLAGNYNFSTYLTVIDPGKSVTAHFHKNGDEHYHIVHGQGEVTLTDVVSRKTTITAVCAQNSFVVAENTSHQLRNSGTDPLILMFSCPAAHLNSDRFFL